MYQPMVDRQRQADVVHLQRTGYLIPVSLLLAVDGCAQLAVGFGEPSGDLSG
jgi:hypothetical protein